MSPAWIRKRKTAAGDARHQVLYRRGGREATIQAAGTFKRDREARLRRDLVAGWLAAGLDPKAELVKLEVEAAPARSFADEAAALIATRHDASTESLRSKRKALMKLAELRPDLAAKPATAWTVSDVQELVAAMVKAGLAPATIDKYLTDGPKLVLDHAGVDPNPARDRRVKLPRIIRAEVHPPTAGHVLAILDRVPRQLVLALVVLEQTGMRVGELVSLPWADVDVPGQRFRLARSRTKQRKPRWVQLPGWLMELVAASCPAEDRTETRRVFQTSESTLRQAMARACRTAEIPLYSPHDLRHRRASLWHGQGLTVAEMKERGGWAKAEIALDVYSHVMPLDELDRDALERVLVRTR
jgi:integrase